MTEPRPILEARGLVKTYGRVVALDHADFELYPGEVLGVIGDNGAGKSTLIKCLSGAVIPDRGDILLDDSVVHFSSPIDARAAGIETVYQNLAVCPALDISANMFLGREVRRPGVLGSVFRMLDHAGMREQAKQTLTELGLLTIQNMGQAVETLSGGQRQGVAVARAAAFGSRVLIMDEPTAALGVTGVRQGAPAHPRRARSRAAGHPHQPQHARTCSRSRTASTSIAWADASPSSRRKPYHDRGRRHHDRRDDGGYPCGPARVIERAGGFRDTLTTRRPQPGTGDTVGMGQATAPTLSRSSGSDSSSASGSTWSRRRTSAASMGVENR